MQPPTLTLFILILTGAILEVDSIDRGKKGERIIMQEDVETILTTTSLRGIDRSLKEAKTAVRKTQMGIVSAAMSLNSTKTKTSLQKLKSEAINEYWVLLDKTSIRFRNFFDLEFMQANREKRAIEFLGEILSSITGVPSAQDYRKILQQVEAIKQENQGTQGLMSQLNAENRNIIDKLHYFDTKINLNSKNIGTINFKADHNEQEIISLFSMTNMAIKILQLVGDINQVIDQGNSIIHSGNSERLSHLALSPQKLSRTLSKIYKKRESTSPLADHSSLEFYYQAKLAHSWVDSNSMSVNTLIQIPIVNSKDVHRLELIPPTEQLFSGLSLMVVDSNNSTMRYLSRSDYAACWDAQSDMLCQKRKIQIFGENCSDIMACKPWMHSVIHDLTNSRIIIIQETSVSAVLACDGKKPRSVRIPSRSIVNLNVHCELSSTTFIVSKLSFRHISSTSIQTDIDYIDLTFDVTAITDEYSPKLMHDSLNHTMASLDSLILENTNFNRSLGSFITKSDRIWQSLKPGWSGWEQIISWSATAGTLLISVLLLFYMIKLHLKLNASIGTKDTTGADDKVKDIIRRLNSIELASSFAAAESSFAITSTPKEDSADRESKFTF